MKLASLVLAAGVLRLVLVPLLHDDMILWQRVAAITAILGIGAFFVLRGTANIIEETTAVLSERTRLAGGMLQSLGTAFPDMVLGIVAALVSLRLRQTDYVQAINYAIIAAATTFGSNIYNIGHAAWCVFRQNLANYQGKDVLMFPGIRRGGSVRPIRDHTVKPTLPEMDTAIAILTVLTVLTAVVAVCMVLFGQIEERAIDVGSDLYQLIRPVGAVIFLLCLAVLYLFRKSQRPESPITEVSRGKAYYQDKSLMVIWFSLLFSGISILLAAESMVHAVNTLGIITGIPVVLVGVLAGIIGCLGEILVVHNFSVHPSGRIGDAIVGVAMDNIVTTMGAAIVAVMGGIFLGGNDLILIFVLILTLNTVLMGQISELKNYFLTVGVDVEQNT